MTSEQALALIDAHGGDAARWPEAERAAVLALAARDAGVAAALAAARELDALLGDWALAESRARPLDDAGLAAIAAPRGAVLPMPTARRRWLAGSAVAAALAAGIILFVPAPPTEPPRGAVIAAATPATTGTEPAASAYHRADLEFGDIFTTTADEEELI